MRILLIGIASLLSVSILIGQSPHWQAQDASTFDYNATAIVRINFDNVASHSTNDTVAFFVGNDIRGLGVPVTVGSEVLHYVTFFSNQATEVMDIMVYIGSEDQTFDALEQVLFEVYGVIGTVDTPFDVNCYLNASPLISVLSLPTLQNVEGQPLDTVNLNDYLVYDGSNPIVWSYVANADLNMSILDSLLVIEAQSGFVGSTIIEVIAAEDITNGNSNNSFMNVIIDTLYQDPLFIAEIIKGALQGTDFDTFDLSFFETQYDGNCLDFDYYPVLEAAVNPDAKPNWTFNEGGGNTMSMVFKTMYTPKHNFQHPMDELAVYVDGVIRGAGQKVMHQGDIHYNITLNGTVQESSPIVVHFYSDTLKQIFIDTTIYTFDPSAVVGNADDPVVRDYSPLIPNIYGEDSLEIFVNDLTWLGEQKFDFFAYDCNYSAVMNDTILGTFCVTDDASNLTTYYIDMDGDGIGSPILYTSACLGSYIGWSDQGTDCNDADPNSTNVDYTLIITESSVVPNDGHVCSNTLVDLSLSGISSVVWSNGSSNLTTMYTILQDSTILFSMTDSVGCVQTDSVSLVVETNVVTEGGNAGPGTLRSVIECAEEGAILYYDQPVLDSSTVVNTLNIDKDLTIQGLAPSLRPIIYFDYQTMPNGINILANKSINLKNVDIIIKNNVSQNATIQGEGVLYIIGFSHVGVE